jgi:pyridoxal phosphate-dependent aminotransferase EpsN
MLITHSEEEARKALFLITQARDPAPYYLHSVMGYNYRMSNICAGIGLVQLETIDERVRARRRNFDFYKYNLSDLPLSFLEELEGSFSNRWLSTALIEERTDKGPDHLMLFLDKYNIEARRIWKPLHTQPLFKGAEFFKVKKKPVSERIFDRGICFPSGTHLDEQTLENICGVIRNFFS